MPRITSFDKLTPNPEWNAQIASLYDSVDDVDLQVGLLGEEPPEGFGFSDTAFRIFILMASRRLKSDRFFTRDYVPEVYTQQGLDWVEQNTMADVVIRHFPELAGNLEGVANAFGPWKKSTKSAPASRWKFRFSGAPLRWSSNTVRSKRSDPNRGRDGCAPRSLKTRTTASRTPG